MVWDTSWDSALVKITYSLVRYPVLLLALQIAITDY